MFSMIAPHGNCIEVTKSSMWGPKINNNRVKKQTNEQKHLSHNGQSKPTKVKAKQASLFFFFFSLK